jgi:hypothetical protein
MLIDLIMKEVFIISFYIYSHVYIFFGPFPPSPSFFSAEPVCSFVLQFFWRENIRASKTEFLPIWDKDSYTERFLALLPCTCVLQPTLVHLYRPLHCFLVPYHSGLGQSKITRFAPLQWAHQPQSGFRFPFLFLFFFISGSSTLFCSSSYLFWGQYHAVFIAIAL